MGTSELNWAIVIQARMGSRRLPGKVLKPLYGKPLLERLFERLAAVFDLERIILATTMRREDDCLIAFAREKWIRFFRGSESDLMDRYYQAARWFGLETVARVTADNPFVDAVELRNLLRLHAEKEAEYSHSLNEFGSHFPKGVGAEVFSKEGLSRVWRSTYSPKDREHVNDYIHRYPAFFRTVLHKAPPKKYAPELSFTVDTMADFKRMESVFRALEKNGKPVSLEEAIFFARQRRR